MPTRELPAGTVAGLFDTTRDPWRPFGFNAAGDVRLLCPLCPDWFHDWEPPMFVLPVAALQGGDQDAVSEAISGAAADQLEGGRQARTEHFDTHCIAVVQTHQTLPWLVQ